MAMEQGERVTSDSEKMSSEACRRFEYCIYGTGSCNASFGKVPGNTNKQRKSTNEKFGDCSNIFELQNIDTEH